MERAIPEFLEYNIVECEVSIFESDDLNALYDCTRLTESDNQAILKDIDETNPKVLNEGNLMSALEAARKKKEERTSGNY